MSERLVDILEEGQSLKVDDKVFRIAKVVEGEGGVVVVTLDNPPGGGE